MELRDALSQIAEIRTRIAATERFHGWRALPVGMTGFIALIAAFLQTHFISEPAKRPLEYVFLWGIAAVVALGVALSGVVYRHYFAPRPLSREMTQLAMLQFAPCLVAGGMVTIAVVRHSPDSTWMLPGLWQVLFSLGIFASCRLMPRAIAGVAAFYLAAGTINLAFGQGIPISPWQMGIPFGLGQLATGWILHRNPETEGGRHER